MAEPEPITTVEDGSPSSAATATVRRHLPPTPRGRARTASGPRWTDGSQAEGRLSDPPALPVRAVTPRTGTHPTPPPAPASEPTRRVSACPIDERRKGPLDTERLRYPMVLASRSRDVFNLGRRTSRQSAVQREQGGVQQLRAGDIETVAQGDVVPEGPSPVQQWCQRIPPHGHPLHTVQGALDRVRVDLPSTPQAPQRQQDLRVEVRRGGHDRAGQRGRAPITHRGSP